MKKLLCSMLCGCLCLTASAQTALQEITENPFLAGANLSSYPVPTVKQTKAPKGYKPFYLSHYARHGSRFLGSTSSYTRPLQVLQDASRAGALTETGQKTLGILAKLAEMSKDREGDLTPRGARQHKGIAARMYKNFPQIFAKPVEIDARSTIVRRCILSMMAECMELQGLNPQLKIKTNASEHDMYYLNQYDTDTLFIKHRRGNKQAYAIRDDYYQRFVKPEHFCKLLFNSDAYVQEHVDAKKLMFDVFKLANGILCLDTDMELHSLFTAQECYELWQLNNIDSYLNGGPSLLSDGQMPYEQSNLLRNIIETADTCITKQASGATLRFGHDSCVLPFTCLLNLNGYGEPRDISTLDESWRSYKIYPMACNVQFVFYRKKGSGDILVKVMLNEVEAQLPISSDVAPYYHWSDFRRYYLDKLSKFQPEKLVWK